MWVIRWDRRKEGVLESSYLQRRGSSDEPSLHWTSDPDLAKKYVTKDSADKLIRLGGLPIGCKSERLEEDEAPEEKCVGPAYAPTRTMTHTSTYTSLFDKDDVDELVGAAYGKLEGDFEKRKEYMSQANVDACEARLGLLRHTWATLLDRAID